MPLGREIKKQMKKYSLNEREYAFATLISNGWDSHSAWYVVNNARGEAWSREALAHEIDKLIYKTKECVGILKNERNGEEDKAMKKEVKQASKMDLSSKSLKETQLTELIAAKERLQAGSREWIDAQKLIADISGTKKSEIKEENKTIHYYLPLKCIDCSLYKEKTTKEHEQ